MAIAITALIISLVALGLGVTAILIDSRRGNKS